MVEVEFLADHPGCIPVLAHWFRAQWPDYYARWSLPEIEQDLRSELNRERLPIRLVAFSAGKPAGTVVLRERPIESDLEHQPGLGGLYVAEPYRRQGVGTELVRAGMEVARGLGYETVYAVTGVAGRLLERLGWEPMESIHHQGEQFHLYRCDLL